MSKDIPLKQSFVESPVAVEAGNKRKTANAVDPNILYTNVRDDPLPAGPAGADKKLVADAVRKQLHDDDADVGLRNRDDGQAVRRQRQPPAAPLHINERVDERRDDRRKGVGGGGAAAAAVASTRIADHPDCRDDVRRICVDGNLNLNNNFAVLDCLQRDRRDGADLSEGCHHHLWSYKKNLTRDERFDAAAFEVCKPALDSLPECQKQVRKLQRIEIHYGLSQIVFRELFLPDQKPL